MHGTGQRHRFLFLQGPHGPFFHRLGKMLTAAGAEVWRVGFNRGDRAFWPTTASYIPFKGTPDLWPAAFARIAAQHAITDLILYGDTRPIHAQAIAAASLPPRQPLVLPNPLTAIAANLPRQGPDLSQIRRSARLSHAKSQVFPFTLAG